MVGKRGFWKRTQWTAIYVLYDNFVRNHIAPKIISAMAAGMETKRWEISDIVVTIEPWEAAEK